MMADITDAEHHVVAASYHVFKALQATNNLSSHVRRILEELDLHLSTVIKVNEDEACNSKELEKRFVSAQQTITSLHSSYSEIWATNPVIETLEDMPLNRISKVLLDQAKSTLQQVMDRLQNELIYTLVQNKQCFEHEYLHFLPVCKESVVSDEDDSVEDVSLNCRSSSETEECVMDLIHLDVIPQIKSIVDVMIASGYALEFSQAFTSFWKDTLAEYSILYMEQLSIKDVLHVEWKHLNSRIRKWRVAMQRLIGIFQVQSMYSNKFLEKRPYQLGLLARGLKGAFLPSFELWSCCLDWTPPTEWLYCLLDMYEVLAAIIPDLDALFTQEIDSLIVPRASVTIRRIC